MNKDLFIDLKMPIVFKIILTRLSKAGILLVGLRKKGVKGGENKESSKSDSQVWMLSENGISSAHINMNWMHPHFKQMKCHYFLNWNGVAQ